MKTMHKLACRALLGLSPLYPAYQMHQEAHALSDKAAGVKPLYHEPPEVAARRERQRGMTDEEKRAARRADPSRKGESLEFFGSDERDAEIERAAPPLLKRAIEIDRDAYAIAGGGLALIGWGLWAVVGPFVRAVLSESKREEPKPSASS